MKTQKLTLYQILFSIILIAVFIYAVLVGDSILLVFSIMAAFALTLILARKQEKIIVDERIQLINEKASTITLNIFILSSSALGFILLGLDNIGYAELSQLGFNLLYSACALMILNLIFGSYYRRKYGG
jgi:uncharacterized membrane protein